MTDALDRDELAAWLRLAETPKVGRDSARKLLAAFGSPEAVLAVSFDSHRQVVSEAVARALMAPPTGFDAKLERTLVWLSERSDTPRAIIPLGDARYPPPLLNTADPPLLLYAQGRVDLLHGEAVAIVGSRNPTPQGALNAREFAQALGAAGWIVVSGLALGVDGAAHEGALAASAGTIAVVGTGLDRVYPRRHFDLAHRIARAGLMLSEYGLGTPALAAHFPQRNRLIAGLSRGTLVIEAALESGSLITARLALEAGREVFAIPGSIHSPQSRGCHALIKQGAKLVESAADVLDELPALAAVRPRTAAAMTETGPNDPLLAAMGYEVMSLDALVARTGWSAHELNTHLLDLELSGQVARLPGQLFQRISSS
ncbi:MAG: DNA-protecting protein DprA [Burkholderiales bacterium PBB1]|nr:MAG: DNA-protecting protein DprA [Burkholderiales bacterium PBB1]